MMAGGSAGESRGVPIGGSPSGVIADCGIGTLMRRKEDF
jgi:hypothetical protein